MPVNDLSEIGKRGLVVFHDEKYFYAKEADWRLKGPLKPSQEDALVTQARAVGAVVASLDKTVYVDLDRLAELEETVPVLPIGAPVDWRPSETSIVFHEKDKLYQVALKDCEELEDGFEGDAGVVVNRGAVVAAIPSNSIPSGTYCVLVNLSSLTQLPV